MGGRKGEESGEEKGSHPRDVAAGWGPGQMAREEPGVGGEDGCCGSRSVGHCGLARGGAQALPGPEGQKPLGRIGTLVHPDPQWPLHPPEGFVPLKRLPAEI